MPVKITLYYFNIDNIISAQELRLKQNKEGKWYLTKIGDGSRQFWINYNLAVRTFGKPYDSYTFYGSLGESRQVPISESAQKEIHSLLKILEKKNLATFTQESATAGETSTAAIASVPNPHISPGPARGKTSYTGSPGRSGTRSPPQPRPKKQKPSDNALDMKNVGLFGQPLRRK